MVRCLVTLSLLSLAVAACAGDSGDRVERILPDGTEASLTWSDTEGVASFATCNGAVDVEVSFREAPDAVSVPGILDELGTQLEPVLLDPSGGGTDEMRCWCWWRDDVICCCEIDETWWC